MRVEGEDGVPYVDLPAVPSTHDEQRVADDGATRVVAGLRQIGYARPAPRDDVVRVHRRDRVLQAFGGILVQNAAVTTVCASG